MRKTDARLTELSAHLIPVRMRVPLKFGAESVDRVTCLRVRATVVGADGRVAVGWGETPLSVTWGWPSATLSYAERYDSMIAAGRRMTRRAVDDVPAGHPIEIGRHLIDTVMEAERGDVPHLAALITISAVDIAVHDAYGNLHRSDVYSLYGRRHLPVDLSTFLDPAEGSDVSFAGRYLDEFLIVDPPSSLPVWHLVGGLDPLTDADRTGDEPDDGYPVTLREWIATDGVSHLKIKLRGDDAVRDYDRITAVADVASEFGRCTLSTDFNGTVTDPAYVDDILDRLRTEAPLVFDSIRYVEQPFPADLDTHPIDVHSTSSRKDLFLDESAHDWRFVRRGRELGWNGVALKTCKTQTGALLSMAWAKVHGMPLMVQDLTNPMLAQIPHVRLAAHAGTIAGVESNAMQFYPEASRPEAAVHPGLYRRRGGRLDGSTLGRHGFGYRIANIEREIPPAAWGG